MTTETIKILYMEDDPGLARLVERKLSRIGFDVVSAPDGASGLMELNKGTFNIVLLDQEMPSMTGIDVLEQLELGTDHPPVIMLTGRGDEELAVEALKKGAADYIVKDVENRYMAVLPTAIERVLRAHADRHERERMRAELRQSEQFLRATLDSVRASVAILDQDGVIQSTNSAWKAAAKEGDNNWAPVDCGDNYLEHCNDGEGLFSEEGVGVAEGVRGVLTGETDEFRYLYPCVLGGETRWFDMGVNLVEGSDPRRALVVHTDVSKLRETENRLRQAQKLEVIGRLTGGVAHEFNNLLQIIEGNLEMAQMDLTEDCPATKHINRAHLAGVRGTRLTKELMAYSRRQTLAGSTINPNRFVSELRQWLENELGVDVRLEMTLSDDVNSIRVDANGLEEAIHNIALNARWAMPDGGVFGISTCCRIIREAMVVAGETAQPGEYVEIAFSDTGFGMSKEVLANAFEPFFTTKEVGQGTGLGLSMVFGFARQSDGYATLESDVDVGTIVRLLLPVAPPISSSL